MNRAPGTPAARFVSERLVRWVVKSAALGVLATPLLGLAWVLAAADWAAVDPPWGARVLVLLGKSAVYAGAVALAAMAAGVWLAWSLMGARHGLRWLALALPPLVVLPLSVQGLNWSTALLESNDWARGAGVDWQFTGWFAAWLAQTLAMVPLAAGVAWLGFSLVDGKLLEAALLYRGPRAAAWRVALPLAWPPLAAGAGLLFLLAGADYTVPSVFALRVYALEVFAAYSAGDGLAGAVVAALPVVGLVGLALGVMLAGGAKVRLFRDVSHRGVWPCRVPRWQGVAAAAGLAFLLGWPLVSLAAGAGGWDGFRGAVVNARDEAAVSFRVAAGCAALVVLLGMGLSHGMLRGRARVMWWVLACALFALPAPLVGIGMLRIASTAGPWLEPWLPLWVCVARFLPVGAFIGCAVWRRLDADVLDAAAVYQRDRWQGMLQVVLPLSWRGWAVAAAAGFTLALGELGASILVAPPGEVNLIIRMYNLLHYGASAEVAAVGLALALPALAIGVVLAVCLFKPEAKAGTVLRNGPADGG